jgi:SSS family solute:Na+ symporter
VVAAFLTGIFSRRTNANGAFAGLISGLVLAVILLFFREDIFGDLHFLFMIPILFVFSILVIYLVSLKYPAPGQGSLENTVFSFKDFREEGRQMRGTPVWNNYRVWGVALVAASLLLLVIFS